MERIPDRRCGFPGIHPVASHTPSMYIAGELVAIATNAQYPRPAMAIPTPIAMLRTREMMLIVAIVPNRMARCSIAWC